MTPPIDHHPEMSPPPPVLELEASHLAQLLSGRAVKVKSTWLHPSRSLALLCQAGHMQCIDADSPEVLSVYAQK